LWWIKLGVVCVVLHDKQTLGNLDFIADDALEYEVDVGQCDGRQVIVNEPQAKGIRRPAHTLCGTL
jgi:hypothetical protein